MNLLSPERYDRLMRFVPVLSLLFLAAIPTVALAEEESDPPYWASIRASEVNMRVGPSGDFAISWVYQRQGLPLKVVRKKEGWRLVHDPDGSQGWVVARFLSRERSAIVKKGAPAPMRKEPNEQSALRWKLAPGVVGKLGECESDWCQLDVVGHKGWVRQDRLWGAGEP